MKIVQINLPVNDNSGNSLLDIHSRMSDALLAAFGGFTALSGLGAWKSPSGTTFSEPVIIYQIAVNGTAFDYELTREIAMHFAEKANQEAVFIVLDGVASILDIACDCPVEGVHP